MLNRSIINTEKLKQAQKDTLGASQKAWFGQANLDDVDKMTPPPEYTRDRLNLRQSEKEKQYETQLTQLFQFQKDRLEKVKVEGVSSDSANEKSVNSEALAHKLSQQADIAKQSGLVTENSKETEINSNPLLARAEGNSAGEKKQESPHVKELYEKAKNFNEAYKKTWDKFEKLPEREELFNDNEDDGEGNSGPSKGM